MVKRKPYTARSKVSYDGDSQHTHKPLQSLWRAVVLQLLLDMNYRPKEKKRQGATEVMTNAQFAAENWLFSNSKDFHEVCEMAGICPKLVRKTAERMKEKPIEWRKAPGQGPKYEQMKRYKPIYKKYLSEQREGM